MLNIDTVPIRVDAVQKKNSFCLPIVMLRKSSGRRSWSCLGYEIVLIVLLLLHNVHQISDGQSENVGRCSHVGLHVDVGEVRVGLQISYFTKISRNVTNLAMTSRDSNSLPEDHQRGIQLSVVRHQEGNHHGHGRYRSEQRCSNSPSISPQWIQQQWCQHEQLRIRRQIPRLEHTDTIRPEVVVDVESIAPPTFPAPLLLQQHPLIPQGTAAQAGKPRGIEGNHGTVRRS